MEIADLPFISGWKKSWKLLVHNKSYVLAAGLLDVIFWFVIGLPFVFDLVGFVLTVSRIFPAPQAGTISAILFNRMTEHIIIIGTLVSEQLRVAAGRARPAVLDVIFQPPVSTYTWQFLGLFVLLVVTVFVFFSILQGLAWWLATSITGREKNWRAYLAGFARINVLWFVLYAAWYCVKSIADLRGLAVQKATGQAPLSAGIALTIVLGITIYFAVLSYPSLSIRTSLSRGIRNAFVLFPAILLVVAHFLAANLLVRWLEGISTLLMFLFGVVLLLVLFAWMRVYLTLTVRSVQ
jgi:hypothetical protein